MRHLLSPRWLVRHLVMLVLVAGFLGLGWWQVGRAADGNTLSYAYAVEWPLFALFVVAIWAREIRQERRVEPAPPPALATVRSPVVVPVRPGAAEPPEDPALSAYNEYLAWLAANPGRRPGEYRPAS